MAHALLPPLPYGACKLYHLVEEQLRTRERQTAASKEKARAGDNSGSRDLMQVLQGAFEDNWDNTVAFLGTEGEEENDEEAGKRNVGRAG